jgi:hypothetical protein
MHYFPAINGICKKMKTTYYTTGFLADSAYNSGLAPFLAQYTNRFPGVSYLHLSLEEITGDIDREQEVMNYFGDGKCLRIRLVKLYSQRLPSPYEIYEELRLIFDQAVALNLEHHKDDFSAEMYL